MAVGNVSPPAWELMRVTKEALEVGIRACQAGNTVSDIGRAIEKYVRSQAAYGIVRDLCGHGVGHAVHEPPYVVNYDDLAGESWKLSPGVVLALEPMITRGNYAVKTLADGWTVVTVDGSLSAHFEHTVVITPNGPVVATRRPNEMSS
ncbi:MAG: M24 family metallopeptidase [Candidatus Magasanikbacteria bacterium]|nr:M24 family metallopeptidase [Candidatus Magasanikbacteria bacterium]